MKVLLAVDFSDHADEAAKFLAQLPECASMEVVLATVVNPPELGVHATTEMWYPEFVDHQREMVQTKHQQVASILEAAGMKVTSELINGHIGKELIRYAEKWKADWIVVGATGHTTIGRLLLGSVSDYVATHAKCTVLVMRPKTLQNNEFLKVSIAYDHSESANKVLKQITARKWPAGTAAQLITAVTPVMVYRDDLFPSAQEEEERRRVEARSFATKAAQSIGNFDAGVDVDVVEGEHTGAAILASADSFGSNLLAVGDKGHGVFERLMLGSTSRYILHHAHQSVLVVR